MGTWWGNLDNNINNTITKQWHITHLIITLIIMCLPASQVQTKQEEMDLELKLHNIINIINTIYTMQAQNKHIINTIYTLQEQNKHMSCYAHFFWMARQKTTQVNYHQRSTPVNHQPHGMTKKIPQSLKFITSWCTHIAPASKHKQSIQMIEQQHLFIYYTHVYMHTQIWHAQNNIHRLQYQTNKVLGAWGLKYQSLISLLCSPWRYMHTCI